MSRPKCLRNTISAVALVILGAGLLYAGTQVLHPEPALAQGVICGGIAYPSGQTCGNTGAAAGVTRSGVYYPTQSSCPSTLGVWCGGAFYPSGEQCGNTGSSGVTCNGSYVANLTSCPTSTTFTSCPDGSLVAVGQNCSTTTIACPNGTVISAGLSCPTTIGTQFCNGTYLTFAACSTGITVTYQAGWNLIGGPTGTVLTGAYLPMYALPAGSGSYVTLPPGTPLQGGSGYWVYFSAPTTFTLAQTTTAGSTVSLPVGTFVMIGNPSNSTVSVSGNNGAEVLVYDPTSGTYSQTSQLNPGQGAWAASSTEGQLSIGAGFVAFGIGPSGGPPPPPPPLPPAPR